MKRVHLIGIGGSGLSAIARLLAERGYVVSGSDMASSPLTDELISLGIQVHIGHQADLINDVELIIRSSAIPDDNPEIMMAAQKGIPVQKRSEFLASFLKDHCTVAVAGTHGKTTTTSMIAWILTSLAYQPGYLIGGISKNLKNNAHAGNSDLFVVEADEYDYMFLGLNPSLAVVTNVDYDHPDCFPTSQDYRQAFVKFIKRLKPDGVLLVSADDPAALSLLNTAPQNTSRLTYGYPISADYQARNVVLQSNGCYLYDACLKGPGNTIQTLASVELSLPGEHNVRNSLAALAATHQLGILPADAARCLKAFLGTERRFDIKGTYNGITLVDDYAHHPTEIRATLQAVRSKYPQQKIVAVWQPHTFSRSKTFSHDFPAAFKDADEVIVTEIYAAREKNSSISAKSLAEQILDTNHRFIPVLDQVTEYLTTHLKPGDVLIVLSAGDAIQINEKLKEVFTNKKYSSSKSGAGLNGKIQGF